MEANRLFHPLLFVFVLGLLCLSVVTSQAQTSSPREWPDNMPLPQATGASKNIILVTPTATPIPLSQRCFGFTDVFMTDYHCASVDALSDVAGRHPIEGYTSAQCTAATLSYPCFQSNKEVTRAEFAKMLYLTWGWTPSTPSTPSFRDVDSSYWAYTYIETAYSQGIINGYPAGSPDCSGVGKPCFVPNASIRRGEIAKMVSNASGFNNNTTGRTPTYVDVDQSNVYFSYVERLVMNDVTAPPIATSCSSTTKPCFGKNYLSPRRDIVTLLSLSHYNLPYSQVFGTKWGGFSGGLARANQYMVECQHEQHHEQRNLS